MFVVVIFIIESNLHTPVFYIIVDGGNLDNDSEVKETIRVPHSRSDLLNKFELLKVAGDGDEDDDLDSGSDIDFEDDSFSDEAT